MRAREMSGTLWMLLSKTAMKWWDDNVPRLSAALSYYTVFSIAPLLLMATAVGGLIFSEAAVQTELFDQIRDLIGPEGAKAIQHLIEEARKPQDGVVATAVSLVAVMVFSTGVFAELQSSLNWIWRTQAGNDAGVWSFVKDRLLTFLLVLGVGFLLVVSLILSAGLAAMGKFFGHLLPVPELAMQLLNAGISFLIFTLLFAMMFKLLPHATIAWKDVWLGAVVTSLLFTVGKSAIGIYLGKSGIASAYGAASSLAVILLWVYYSALMFFFGAEFTFVYATELGSLRGLTSSAASQHCEPPLPSTAHASWIDKALLWSMTAALLAREARAVLRSSDPSPASSSDHPRSEVQLQRRRSGPDRAA